jgi:hypothetical protein
MASLLNALQLALGAGGAGISGYQRAQAQREEEERLKREEARRAAAEQKAAERQLKMDERQTKMDEQQAKRQGEADAAALRRERREALDAGFVKASQYTGINPRDMPGATPRQPTERQMIGGEEYVLPEAPSTVKHREGAMKMMTERKELDSALAAGEAAGMDPRKLAAVLKAPASVQGVIASRLFPAPERGKEELSDTEKRRRGLQFLSGQTFNPALTKALQSTFAADPAMAEDPYMAAYDIMASKTVKPITPMQRYKPPVQKEKADPVEELIKAGEERNKGKAGGAATVSTPAAAPAPRPAAAPTAAPAEPASLADAAAKQASRAELWDQLKAQNPTMSDDEITARVMREIR